MVQMIKGSIIVCEDSNLHGSQHSPEPADIVKLQELCRASTTRPICQEIFSQAKPTSTRSGLVDVGLAWENISWRMGLMVLALRSSGSLMPLAGSGLC